MKEIIYSKFSNERARVFCIRTDITEEDGKREVVKTAFYPEGRKHIENLQRWYGVLSQQYRDIPYLVNTCREIPGTDSVRLEYLEAETLSDRLDRMRKTGRMPQWEKEFASFLRDVEKSHQEIPFVMTDEFRQVFGDRSLPEGMRSAAVTNIDLITQNLVLTPVPTVIDYEWVFEFPIPVKFLLFRSILYLLESGDCPDMTAAFKFYDQFGISESMRTVFLGMEMTFQDYLTKGHVPVRDMFDSISPGIISLQLNPPEALQVFFLTDKGYVEESSVIHQFQNGQVSCTIRLPEGCTHIRIDPGNFPCMVSITKLAFDQKEASLAGVKVPGGYLNGRRAFFAKEDPYFADIPVPRGAETLSVKMTITRCEKKIMEKIVQQELENRRLKEQLGAIKSSRLWKVMERTIRNNS